MNQARRLSSLYICYLALSDPLVHTQVVVYLRGLAADGHRVHLLTFETERLTGRRRRELRRDLAADGIRWHGLRYHKRPSLPATAYDTLAGALYAAALVLRHGLDALHARNHVPAAMALGVRRLLWWRRVAVIFDVRGLMAEEYEDMGRWQRDGAAFRLTKNVEHRAIARAEGIVVLTERVRRQLFGDEPDPHIFVIPCCADVERLAAAEGEREAVREALGLGAATVMVYVGKFGGWYMTGEMAEFFAVARRSIPDLHFLILTQGPREEIDRELAGRGVGSHYTVASAPPDKLGGYLAAADFGISFIRPSPSKVSSSPTKVGEYLAAGLPVLSTSGVGDLDSLLSEDVGVLIDRHTESSYQDAAERLAHLLAQPGTRERCQALARQRLSLDEVGIPRYRKLYEYVAEPARPDLTAAPELPPVPAQEQLQRK